MKIYETNIYELSFNEVIVYETNVSGLKRSMDFS